MGEKPRLESALPLCPLVGMPPVERAWSVKRGDVVLLRLTHQVSFAATEAMHDVLKLASERSGVEFLLLGPDVEVVPPAGDVDA